MVLTRFFFAIIGARSSIGISGLGFLFGGLAFTSPPLGSTISSAAIEEDDDGEEEEKEEEEEEEGEEEEEDDDDEISLISKNAPPVATGS